MYTLFEAISSQRLKPKIHKINVSEANYKMNVWSYKISYDKKCPQLSEGASSAYGGQNERMLLEMDRTRNR